MLDHPHARFRGGGATALATLALLALSITWGGWPKNSGRQPLEVADNAGSPGIGLSLFPHSGTDRLDQRASAQMQAAYGRLPLSFELNQGQAQGEAQFLARASGYQFYLTAAEAILCLPSPDDQLPRALPSGSATSPARQPVSQPQPANALRLKLVNAHPAPEGEGLDELPGKSHYLIGGDPARWRTGIRSYARVRYRDVYPGVSLTYYGNQRQLEYDFVVAPGADPRRIHLAFEGAQQMRLDGNGDLLLQVAGGEVRQRKPVIYQEADREFSAGARRMIAGHYVLRGEREVGFEIAAYDPGQPLVIDPVLSYSTYLGGAGSETGYSIAVDQAGNAYVAGTTSSDDFPLTPGALKTTSGGGDVFVAKLNAAGTALVYATYFGGASSDVGYSLTVDAAGQVYVTGSTASTNFPTTPGALRAEFSGGEAFVAKLSAAGDALIYSTYLGGSKNDIGYGIAVDPAGSAYVTGLTTSTNFPVTAGAAQSAFGGGSADAFIVKLNPAGSALLYATYLGGSSGDDGRGIAIDADGNAYVTGNTSSGNFPATSGALQTAYGGGGDAFVAKLNAAGGSLLYATYLGGGNSDRASSIAIDAAGQAHIAGDTVSNNFPATPGALQTAFGGGSPPSDAFVAKLNAGGTALLYATYLGGAGTDRAFGIALGSAGQAYLTGSTFSATLSNNFAVTANAFQPAFRGNMDAFIAELSSDGSALLYSTFLGLSGNETGSGIAADAAGNVYLIGSTSSANFLTTPQALQAAYSGSQEAFITRMGTSGSGNLSNVSAASFDGTALTSDSIVSAFGSGLATAVQSATTDPLPSRLAGTEVKVKDRLGVERPAQLFFVSQEQVNYLMPAETASGAATVMVISGDGTTALGTVQIVAVAPGLFAANANGQGVAAAIAVRVKPDHSQSFELVAEFDAAQQRFIARPLDLGPETDTIVLLLFGTGIRHRTAPTAVTARIGGLDAPVDYAGPQSAFAGLDQINVRVPRALAGRNGEVDIVLTVDGQPSNAVKIRIK
jgi:uncharacterized protein (TIGR03437 family)